ncbi:kinase-like protein [Aureobasidium pullulans]|uniref:Kinase-like protein n=1 Tax=Aureobasidium pullulans TaxID=5580 RepID=A0A4S9DCE6_AURPU|nr:kinase-like protein [Aureobasidium pullulans]
MSSRFFKDLRERIHQKTNESFCEEVHRALRESLQPEIESSDLFVTAQSCKDVWEAYRRYHKMSFLQLVAKEMRWSQDVKKRIHKDRLNTLSALVWLVNDWKSFVKLVRLFKLEEQEFTILEDINVRAHTNTKQFDEILDIRLSDSNKRHSPDEIRDDIKRAQQIFFPVQILPMSDIPQKLPAGRRMPFLEVARIYPPKSNRSGLSAEKSVARVKVADGYLPPISRTNSVVAVKKAMVSKVNKERRALSKLAQYESRPDSIMVCLGAVQIGEICYIVSDLALCDLRMVLNQQLDEDCINRLPPTDELRGPSYLLGGALGIAKGLEWLHWELPHFYDQPQECFHLDLKPSNILVFGAEKSWMWKIADFGEASICVHDERANNGEGTDERSPVTTTRRAPDVYQAPEVEIENGVVGRTCDIWSFGCILLDILAFASFSHTGVKRLQAVRSDARENSVRMPIAFYGREGGTGTPSLKAELIEMFRDTSILGSPWLSIGHAPAPKWIKRYVSRIKAEKTLITDTGQWLIHKSSEHIGSLSLGETVLWDDIEGLPQLQTCFSGAIQLENVKFMDTSDMFLAVLCVGTSPADNVIMVQRLDQEELSEKIHVIHESSPMGLSVSCDGLVLVCFRNYVRLYCPGSVSYDKHFGTSELQTACFSDDGKHVYAWSIEDSGSNGTRTRSWYVWETTSWETPPRPMKHRVQWKNTQRSATHVVCRETMVPLNGIPYQFDKDDAPPGGTVLLHFMYFDHLGNVTLISSQSTTLSSFQLPHRITGVYQAYALLEGHRPKICLVRSQVGRGFKVEYFEVPPPKTSTWSAKSLKEETIFTEVEMLTSLTKDFDATDVGFRLRHSHNGSMAYVVGTEGGKTIVKKAKLL